MINFIFGSVGLFESNQNGLTGQSVTSFDLLDIRNEGIIQVGENAPQRELDMR